MEDKIEEYYEKIHIKNEEDLPKDILLFVGNKRGFIEVVYIEEGETKKPFRYDSDDMATLKINDIDWYLRPSSLKVTMHDLNNSDIAEEEQVLRKRAKATG